MPCSKFVPYHVRQPAIASGQHRELGQTGAVTRSHLYQRAREQAVYLYRLHQAVQIWLLETFTYICSVGNEGACA